LTPLRRRDTVHADVMREKELPPMHVLSWEAVPKTIEGLADMLRINAVAVPAVIERRKAEFVEAELQALKLFYGVDSDAMKVPVIAIRQETTSYGAKYRIRSGVQTLKESVRLEQLKMPPEDLPVRDVLWRGRAVRCRITMPALSRIHNKLHESGVLDMRFEQARPHLTQAKLIEAGLGKGLADRVAAMLRSAKLSAEEDG
jgi:hypothetical protein